MHFKFSDHFSPQNNSIFSTLSAPRLEAQDKDRDSSPKAFLRSAGVHSLRELVERREEGSPIDLGMIDDDGRYDPFRARLQYFVKELFVGESVHLERHAGHEHASRRPPQHFDVRSVGRCPFPATGDTVELFCCRYGETVDVSFTRALEAFENPFEEPEESSHLRLAIPSRAGLVPPDAVSLVCPLRMSPREYVLAGEAGAVLACTQGKPGYAAELYWSEPAFVESLNRVQEIGRSLIEHDAVARAAMRRVGETEFSVASAMFSKMYEEAAQFSLAQAHPLFLTGVWGVAIFPRKDGRFDAQIGVAGLELDPSDATSPHGMIHPKNESFAVMKQILERDQFGFLSISSDRFCRLEIKDIPWYSKLPILNQN